MFDTGAGRAETLTYQKSEAGSISASPTIVIGRRVSPENVIPLEKTRTE
jgi:hypothetical protein